MPKRMRIIFQIITYVILLKQLFIYTRIVVTHIYLLFGAFRRVNSLGLVQLGFHVTFGDAVTVKDFPQGKIMGYD